MSYWLRVEGRAPSKSNTYRIVRRGSRSGLAKDDDVTAFEERLAHQGRLLLSSLGTMPFPHPTRVEIWIVWHRQDHDGRRRDLGNLEKAICDGINRSGLWDDDSQVSTIHMTVRYDGGEDEWIDIALMPDPDQPMPAPRRRRRAASATTRSATTRTRSTA